MAASTCGTWRPAPAAPERSRRRDLRHSTWLILPWLLLVALWWRVLAPDGPGALGQAGIFVAACAAATTLLTAWWVAHNLGIHKAKGPRRGLPDATLSYEQDWHGRRVVADWTALRRAPTVFVAGRDKHKVFVVGLRRDRPVRRPSRAHARPAAMAVSR